MQRSAAHKNKKPMIVVIGDAARTALLEWYPVAAGAVAQSTRTISIEEEQAELWDLTTVKRQRTLTQSVIANTSIVVCAEPLAEKDKELLKGFEKSYVLYLTDNAKQDKNNLSDLIWLCGSGVDLDSLKTCNKQEIGNLKFLHKWLDESGFDCRSIAKVAKSDLFEAIKKIHSIENRAYLLLQCLNEETLLGKRFWTKDWDEFRELSLDKGLLKDICDELIRINPAYKGIIEAKAYLRSAKDWCEDTYEVSLRNIIGHYNIAALIDPRHAAIYRQQRFIRLKDILENKDNNKDINDLLKSSKRDLYFLITSYFNEEDRIALLLVFFDASSAVYKILNKTEKFPQNVPNLEEGIYRSISQHLIKIDPNYALTINQYLENNTNTISYYKNKVREYMAFGEINEAIEVKKKILEVRIQQINTPITNDPSNSYGMFLSKLSMFSLYRKIGNLYLDSKKYDESISYYTQALQSPFFYSNLNKKERGAFYLRRGNAYCLSGKYVEAIADYKEILQVCHNDCGDYFYACSCLAFCYMNLGEKDEAETYLKQSLNRKLYSFYSATHCEHSLAYTNVGYVYLSLGESEKAEAAVKKAISLNINNSIAYYYLGKIYSERGQLMYALYEFDKSLSLHADCRVYLARALTREGMKHYEKALEDYICAINGGNEDAKENLKSLLKRDILLVNVCEDLILNAIALFDGDEKTALMNLYTCTSNPYRKHCIDRQALIRSEEQNADEYMQFFNQIVCEDTLFFWKDKESDKDAPIYQMYHIAQDSSKSNVKKREEIMRLAAQETSLFCNQDVKKLYITFKEENISDMQNVRNYFSNSLFDYYNYAEKIDDFFATANHLMGKRFYLLCAIIKLDPCEKYYVRRANFLLEQHKYYVQSLSNNEGKETVKPYVFWDMLVSDLNELNAYGILARLYEKKSPEIALDYYRQMVSPPELPVARLSTRLDMHRDALVIYHDFYIYRGVGRNYINEKYEEYEENILSFIINVIAKNAFVEQQSDNHQLLCKDDDVKMIKDLLDECSKYKKVSIMVEIQTNLPLLYHKLEKLEYSATYKEKDETAVSQAGIFFFSKSKQKNTDDFFQSSHKYRPTSSSSDGGL